MMYKIYKYKDQIVDTPLAKELYNKLLQIMAISKEYQTKLIYK